MRLHRTVGTADWLEVAPGQWNRWQQVAATTHGYLTPGNLVSAAGLMVVIFGLAVINRHHYWLGLGLLVAGRLGDLLDGWLADRTGTKSLIGERLDEIADKLGTAAVVIVFYAAHIAPWWLLSAMLAPQLLIACGALVGMKKHWNLHPSRLGKRIMAGFWICLCGFLLLKAMGTNSLVAWLPFDILAILASLLGFYAGIGYWNRRHQVD